MEYKTICYKVVDVRENSYSVPVWVKYIAVDADGCMYGFKYHPYKSLHNGVWHTGGNNPEAETYLICVLDKGLYSDLLYTV